MHPEESWLPALLPATIAAVARAMLPTGCGIRHEGRRPPAPRFRVTPMPLVMGLHITKCAGTSFITTIRRHLADDEFYVCSSYYENWLARRPMLAEISDISKLSVIFGHFFHECLVSACQRQDFELITGLRDPLRRAVSHFRQVNAVRHAQGLPLAGAYEFLMEHPNAICTEILRAFPSIDEASDEPQWAKAAGALSLFDFIYATENFAEDGKYLLSSIGIVDGRLFLDNISDEKDFPADRAAEIDRQIGIITAEFAEYFDQDIALCEAMRPYLSRPGLQRDAAFGGAAWRVDGEAYFAGLPPAAAALEVYTEFERRQIAFEFASQGRVGQLIRDIDQRIELWQHVKQTAANIARSLKLGRAS
jgi:hypothetical protein